MAGNTILVVDDEQRMRKLVRDFLTKQNFRVLEAADGEEAVDVFMENKDIVLVILDVMMPKMDGWETCREIRQYSKVPIIMLTARGGENDELRGFELGVDEYIAKPFSPKILVARVEALLRRTNSANEKNLEYGGIVLNRSAHEVIIDGEKVDLSYKEFELLRLFLSHPGMAFTRDQLMEKVWGVDYCGETRTVDMHIRTLRQKLGENGEHIETVRGVGYRWEAEKN